MNHWRRCVVAVCLLVASSRLAHAQYGPGYALNFDGSDDYVSTIAASVPTGNSPYTIEAWVLPNDMLQREIVAWGEFGTDNRVNAFRIQPGQLHNFWWNNDLTINTADLTDTWHHVVARFDGTTRTIFIDDILTGGDSPTGHDVPYGTNLTIGSISLLEFFNGQMDEVRIWDHARSDQDLEDFANSHIADGATGLVLYLRMDEGTGTDTADSANLANTGQLQNGTAWITSSAPVGVLVAETIVAFDIKPDSANVQGKVNPNGEPAYVWFEWGYDTNFGNATAELSYPGVTNWSFVTDVITNMIGGTTVYYRIAASNIYGKVYGVPKTFFSARRGGGTALGFDGVDDYAATLSTFGSAMPTTEVTVEFWQRVFATVGQSTFAIYPDEATNRFQAHVPWSDGIIYWDFGDISGADGRLDYFQPEPLDEGNWQHFALVASQSGNYMRVYRNGVLEAEQTNMDALSVGSYVLELGRLADSGAYLGGQLDEFRIWSVARSQTDIASNRFRRILYAQPELVCYYRCDEGVGATSADVGNNAFTLTLNNGVSWVPGAPLGLPIIGASYATNLTTNAVFLVATVDPQDDATEAWIEYGATTNYGTTIAAGSLPAGGGFSALGVDVSNLLEGATYHFRVAASNYNGYTNGPDCSFLTKTLPDAVTLPASDIGATSGTLNSTVNPFSAETYAWFEYGTDITYGAVTPATLLGPLTSAVPVSFTLTGLTPGITYHYRSVASNEVGIDICNDESFTPPILPPEVVTLAATGVAHTAAWLNGTADANGFTTHAWFEWGTDPSLGNTTTVQNIGNGDVAVPLTEGLSGLQSNLTYYFTILASNDIGVVTGALVSFYQPATPTVTTGIATNIEPSSASLEGVVNPNGAGTDIRVDYGTDTTYGASSVFAFANGTNDVPVSGSINGLTGGTLYHYRIAATNSEGETLGDDATFTTLFLAPEVQTLFPSLLGPNYALLTALVDPNALETTGWFEYGTTTNYDSSSPTFNTGVVDFSGQYFQLVSNLTAQTEYHVRIVAQNAAGITYGDDVEFTTPLFLNAFANIEPVEDSAVGWADYDNDGDLDFILCGWEGSDVTSILYRNDGTSFVDAGADIRGVEDCSVSWGDYDRDGDLDLLLTGYDGVDDVSLIYTNDAGSLSELDVGLPGVEDGDAEWGDYDNDGDLDILIAGDNSGTPVTAVYRNDGGDVFTDIGGSFLDVDVASVAWGDYDNDEDLDFVLTGDNFGVRITRIYRYQGGDTFIPVVALFGVRSGDAEWGDYDGDGDLDVAVVGSSIARIYRNDDGSFTTFTGITPGTRDASAAWGDYDNDGDLDLLINGFRGLAGSIYSTRIMRNDGVGFVDIGPELPDTAFGDLAWADYNGDGRLDVLITGEGTVLPRLSALYENHTAVSNTPPTTPTGLLPIISDDNTLAFRWSASTDGQSLSSNLTYAVRVRDLVSGANLLLPSSFPADGLRKVAALGEQGHGVIAHVDLPAPLDTGTVYAWSVQAIDSAFEGSEWAPERQFVVGPNLVGLAKDTNGLIRLRLSVSPTSSNDVEVTTNYTDWTYVTNVVAGTNGLLWITPAGLTNLDNPVFRGVLQQGGL